MPFTQPSLVWPFKHTEVFETRAGTKYLKEPGVVLVGQTQTNLEHLDTFLKEFGFEEYLDDPTSLPAGETLSKFGGQLCYMSLGKARTMNENADKYFENIRSSGHGSVVEHATASVLMYGISRSNSHELVRHRAGTGFSQLSQRYVSGKLLRFVERPEYQNDPVLHGRFERWIDSAAEEYEFRGKRLLERQEAGDTQMTSDHRTELRKKVNQAARSCLPNETETIILFTGNVRAWRHIFEMRAAGGAEPEIRNLIFLCFTLLRQIWPVFTEDYHVIDLPGGTHVVETKNRKV